MFNNLDLCGSIEVDGKILSMKVRLNDCTNLNIFKDYNANKEYLFYTVFFDIGKNYYSDYRILRVSIDDGIYTLYSDYIYNPNERCLCFDDEQIIFASLDLITCLNTGIKIVLKQNA